MGEVDYKELKKMVKAVNDLKLVDKIKFVAVKKEELEEDFCDAVEAIVEDGQEDKLPKKVKKFYEENFVLEDEDEDEDEDIEEEDDEDEDIEEEDDEDEEDTDEDEGAEDEDEDEDEVEEKPKKKNIKKGKAKKSSKKEGKKDTKKDKKKSKKKPVTTAILELVCKKPTITTEQIVAKLEKAGYENPSKGTISIQKNWAKKVIDYLDKIGKLK